MGWGVVKLKAYTYCVKRYFLLSKSLHEEGWSEKSYIWAYILYGWPLCSVYWFIQLRKQKKGGSVWGSLIPLYHQKYYPIPPFQLHRIVQILIWPFAKVNEHVKFIISPYAKVYDREMQKFHKLMNLQKFLLYTKVSDPISILIYSRKMTTRQSGWVKPLTFTRVYIQRDNINYI